MSIHPNQTTMWLYYTFLQNYQSDFLEYNYWGCFGEANGIKDEEIQMR